jgi:hypothetical protein
MTVNSTSQAFGPRPFPPIFTQRRATNIQPYQLASQTTADQVYFGKTVTPVHSADLEHAFAHTLVNTLKTAHQEGDKLLFAFNVDGILAASKKSVMPQEGLEKLMKLPNHYGADTKLAFVTSQNLKDTLGVLGGEKALKGKNIVLVTDHGLHSFDCKTWKADVNFSQNSKTAETATANTETAIQALKNQLPKEKGKMVFVGASQADLPTMKTDNSLLLSSVHAFDHFLSHLKN